MLDVGFEIEVRFRSPRRRCRSPRRRCCSRRRRRRRQKMGALEAKEGFANSRFRQFSQFGDLWISIISIISNALVYKKIFHLSSQLIVHVSVNIAILVRIPDTGNRHI